MSRAEGRRRGGRRFLVGILVTVLAILAGVLLFVVSRYDLHTDLSLFEVDIVDATTRFYYYDEGPVRVYKEENLKALDETLYGERKMLYCEYEDIPKDLVNAFIAIEDKRFYEHSGVDLYRTAGALANSVFGFDKRFGASTITQQLIKNVTGRNEVTFDRKVQEILWALDLERNFGKEEILEKYLNVINLSEGCYGVGAAANLYYSKTPSELTLSECATLAAITNSPTYYDPLRNPENNKVRRDLILDAMLEQGYIDAEAHIEAKNSSVELNINEDVLYTKINSWYVDMAVEDVICDLVAEYGYSREAASRMVYNGGLRIVLAVDPYVQSVMERYYENVANFKFWGEELAQSSMIVMNPYSGDILGVVGGVGEKSGNRVQSYATTAKRPSGSTIKPLSVYAPALERGMITWASVYDDVPQKLFSNKGKTIPWPQNATLVYQGLVNVNYALKHSLNTVPVELLGKVGLDDSFLFLRDTLGMTSLVEKQERVSGGYVTDKVPASLALGQQSFGVTLREITEAYTMFSNRGEYTKGRSYIRVTDSKGRELLSNKTEHRAAISSANACIMTKMLQGVIATGTASPVKLDGFVDVAGKTGTTQDSKDKWFIAYTPYCLGGLWYGYEYPKPVEGRQKKTYLEVWDHIMSELHRSYFVPEMGVKHFEMDKDVVSFTYCKDSGKRMTTACYLDPRLNRAEVGYFVRGTEPRGFCNCHVVVSYDTEYGGVACPDCDPMAVRDVGMLRIKRSFSDLIYIVDAQYVYRDLPPNVPPCTDPHKPFFANLLGNGEYCGSSGVLNPFNAYCHRHACPEEYADEETAETEPPYLNELYEDSPLGAAEE